MISFRKRDVPHDGSVYDVLWNGERIGSVTRLPGYSYWTARSAELRRYTTETRRDAAKAIAQKKGLV